MRAPSVGGYYGGIGGALLGARWAGYDIVYNYEPRAFFNKATWNANFPEGEHIGGGILTDWLDFPKVDLLIGSPDCKQFSNLGTKRKDRKSLSNMDPNAFDYVDFLHFVDSSKPKGFILENVPNILNYLKFDDNVLRYVGWEKPVLTLTDYNIQTVILNAKDFGVPQSRKRAFVIGSKNFKPGFTIPFDGLSFLIDSGYCMGKTVSSAFEDISPTQKLPNHTAKRIAGFKNLRVGESYYGSQNNKRLDPNKIAGTVASHCSRFVHPTEPRVISINETARLMGFPDSFTFHGRETEVLDQMGKSIIPQISYSISSYIADQL